MSIPRFHVEAFSGPVVQLSEDEARHACGPRRLRMGDAVAVFDGQGGEAAGTIVSESQRAVEVEIGQIHRRLRSRPMLTLAIAVPKGPRQDYLIEKCSELGTAEIQPLITERSVASPSDHKIDKWRRTTIEAAKQSGAAWLPTLNPPRPLEEVLVRCRTFDCRLFASPGRETILACLEELARAERLVAFIGPEGGWTDAEVAKLIHGGARPVSLGPHILRIETAAVALAAICHGLSHAEQCNHF